MRFAEFTENFLLFRIKWGIIIIKARLYCEKRLRRERQMPADTERSGYSHVQKNHPCGA